ncbi:MAG TPA: FAD-linked oxidase C-terminal domain-containing protein, partial [Microbacterium sp.]|nr:FAD-linked oxidase C-terminal domain-containing protein [Microbacterium sp.]
AVMGGHLLRMTGALAVATFEAATAAEAERVRAETGAVFERHGAKTRGEDPARSWERGRFSSPVLRDSLMDIGVLAETLETATAWSTLATLKAAVTTALTDSLTARGTAPIVMCHISHVYPAGASLYFTVVAALTEEPLAQWADAKASASRAIAAAGGTVTHHHAVGRDHRAGMAAEIGGLGIEVLRGVKRTLDPQGIMNPGVLVPPTP